ncbi:family 65 glycosyl hydrolase [Paenibacillus athensensis]|uniref:Family 65 glycosyl hydrolase n=1 Tax=Paenibacillus athensensis TaxID=1967502 RepID=A0A4Y8PPF7_9BACL|nr:glycosyl hydrolase family 65 protein [Paenibacillus athensensis]MCD1258120.1 family 65 glycosyl hydrolase [Paenibacillus athensensis]
MAKVADKYLKVDPWGVVEEGFDRERNRVSESIFSLGNEYMGVRGYPDEGYSGDSMVGSYFNGLYDETHHSAHYKGIVKRVRFMVNAVDWLYTRLTAGDEQLDLATSKISGFVRKLDFKSGTVTREFVWHLSAGSSIKVSFERFVGMTNTNVGCQRVTLESVDFTGDVWVRSGLDFSPIHEAQHQNLWTTLQKGEQGGIAAILSKTKNTDNRLFASFALHTEAQLASFEEEQLIGYSFTLQLVPGQAVGFDKVAFNYAEKDASVASAALWAKGQELAAANVKLSYDALLADQKAYWTNVWETTDITIEGDPENQQGIRFCVFQLYQTYHGDNPGLNIGAKGLTGEAYGGHAFWDTESYCLPFYLFNNPKAAKSLLEFRYKSLAAAIERGTDVDCNGAFYPIATIDGTESCNLWQHSNLQLHVGTAISYGIWHYDKIIGDKEFIRTKGIEMLLQISRFYASRGQWGQRSGKFGYYGVMGPDEFQLMVNNNCYINYMAKKLFEYTLEVVREMKAEAADAYASVAAQVGVTDEELANWQHLADHMAIPYEAETGIYEEHDGFFDMPHIDIHSIPVTDFPLYSNWSYDRLYRYDMIKQPDVLMFMFLYNQEFTREAKTANYNYYEPRTIHESSLSPSIHSIIASEIGKHEEAYQFFEFATRLDLDNYNRNTREGLHTTSIAAAWMNIVYGFGGMRSDGDMLLFQPSIPQAWSSYSFKLLYKGAAISVAVNREQVTIKAAGDSAVDIQVYDQTYSIGADGITLPVPAEWVG